MYAKPLYCPQCGAGSLEYRIPPGDTKRRNLCGRCGYIIYQNPLMVAGAILEWEGKILLCRRAIKPKFGLWTLPAGFMENHETVEECARRECMEEANAAIEDIQLFSLSLNGPAYETPESTVAFFESLGRAVSTLPGVESTALVFESANAIGALTRYGRPFLA